MAITQGDIVLILIIIGFVAIGSMFFTAILFEQEITNFCQENGFEYNENFDGSSACWKNTPTETIVRKTKCRVDWFAAITFRNPCIGCCKFLKQTREIQ
jgi:hypothetical protein